MLVKSKQTGRMLNVPDAFYQANPQLYQTEQEQPVIPQQPTQAPPQQDFMSGLLNFGKEAVLGMASPFIKTGQNIGGAGFETIRALKQLFGDKNAYVNQQTGETVQNPFLSQQQLQSVTQNPVAEVARNTAGIASYAVPYGKGANILTRAILPGATQGGMFAASKEGATGQDVAGGAAGGGLFGGALYGLGKLLGGFKGAGQSMRKQVLNPQVEATPYYSNEVGKMQKLAGELGLSGGADSQLSQLNKVWDTTAQEVKNQLKGQKTQALFRTAAEDFKQSLDKSNYLETMPGYKEAQASLSKRLMSIFDHGSASAESLYNLKSELRQELTKTFNKPALTPKEEVKQALFESLKTTLDDLVPGIRGLNQKEAQLFELSKGLVKNAETKFRLPLLGAHVSEQPFQAAGDTLGRMFNKIGGAQGAVQAVQKSPLPIPAGQEIMKNLTKPSQAPSVSPIEQENVIPSPTTSMGGEQGVRQISFEQLQRILLSPAISDKTKERFKYIYEQQSQGAGKKMSAVTAKDLSRNQTALKDINTLEKSIAKDPTAIIRASLPGSPGARQYRAVMGGIIDAIGTNRTGAAYTADQRKDYEYLLPVPGDSPETIQFKIQRLKDEIGTYVQNISSSSPAETTVLQ